VGMYRVVGDCDRSVSLVNLVIRMGLRMSRFLLGCRNFQGEISLVATYKAKGKSAGDVGAQGATLAVTKTVKMGECVNV
jgi:hypothetical protein